MRRQAISSKNDISSTAKLLDMIRGDSTTVSGAMEALTFASSSEGQRLRAFLQHLPLLRRRLVVGIEIGTENLILVKMLPLSSSRHKLLDHRLVPFKPPALPGSPAFGEFLREVVLDFVGSLKRVSLWASLPAVQGDLRQIRIPRKAAGEKLVQAVYWVARKEMRFDEEEALFDFEIQQKVAAESDGKTWIMAYTAGRNAVKEAKELFAKSGLELAGLTIAPFVVQNLFRSQWIPNSGTPTYAALQLGHDASRISIFFRENLILTKVIGIAGDLFDPSSGLELTDNETPEEKVSPVLEELIDEIETIFQYHSGPGKGAPISKLFLSGPIMPAKAFVAYLGKRLDVKVVTVNLLRPANPFLTQVRPLPCRADRPLYASALGLALSDDSRTPNLLCPFVQKTRKAGWSRLNRSLLWAFALVMLVLGGLFFWQDHARSEKRAELTRLNEELARFTPITNPDMVTELASKVKARQRLLASKAEKYLSLAVLSELAALTPDTIRLLSVTADFGGLPETATRDLGTGQIKSISRSLVIEGVIEGDGFAAETSLAHYLMRLGASPLFVDPAVHQSSQEISQELGQVLHFFLRMGLGQGG